MKKITLFVLFSLCAGFLATACVNGAGIAAQAQTQGDIQKTFSVQPGGRLMMDVDLGSIEVKTTGDSKLVVDVYRKVKGGNPEEVLRKQEISFDQQGNDLSIRARFPSGIL